MRTLQEIDTLKCKGWAEELHVVEWFKPCSSEDWDTYRRLDTFLLSSQHQAGPVPMGIVCVCFHQSLKMYARAKLKTSSSNQWLCIHASALLHSRSIFMQCILQQLHSLCNGACLRVGCTTQLFRFQQLHLHYAMTRGMFVAG